MQRLDAIADVARTESGGETVTATCERCEQPFECEQHYVRYPRRPGLSRSRRCARPAGKRSARARASYALRRFEQAMARYRDGHLGSRLAGASFAAFQEGPHNAAALKAAQRWLSADPRPNLLIVGPVGSGRATWPPASITPCWPRSSRALVECRVARDQDPARLHGPGGAAAANRWLAAAETAPCWS